MKYDDWDIPEGQREARSRAHESVNSESANKRSRIQRDEELQILVHAKDMADPDFTWSWRIVNGTYRVSISPRVFSTERTHVHGNAQ